MQVKQEKQLAKHAALRTEYNNIPFTSKNLRSKTFIDNRENNNSQRQLVESINHFPSNSFLKVAQRRTEISHLSEPMSFRKGKASVGVAVNALLDPEDPIVGSEPGDDVQKSLMGAINTFFPHNKHIRGHLLNADLGGAGLDYNLFPISQTANTHHSDNVETPLKRALSFAKLTNKVVNYHVDVYYAKQDEEEKTGYLESRFICNANYLDKPQAVYLPQIFPQTEIISKVEKLEEPTRRSVYYPEKDSSFHRSLVDPLNEWHHLGKAKVGDKGKYPNNIDYSEATEMTRRMDNLPFVQPDQAEQPDQTEQPEQDNQASIIQQFRQYLTENGDAIFDTLISAITGDANLIPLLHMMNVVGNKMNLESYFAEAFTAGEVKPLAEYIAGIATECEENGIEEIDALFYAEHIDGMILRCIDTHIVEFATFFSQLGSTDLPNVCEQIVPFFMEQLKNDVDIINAKQ